MIQQMTPRERTLAMIVGLIVVACVNLFLFDYFVKQNRQLRSDFALKTLSLTAKRALLADRDVWQQREQWLAQKQVKLTDPDRAATTLLATAQDIAKKHSIVLENTVLGKAETKPQYVAVGVTFDTKSKWADLVGFLREMQTPEQFIVFENANLQADSADKTQMHGRFRLQKWYAAK